MTDNSNQKLIAFSVEKGNVSIEIVGNKPFRISPETAKELANTLNLVAEEAEKTSRHEVKIDFDEIYDFLGKAETKPNRAPLTYTQTQAEPFRSFINDQGKKFNGIGISVGIGASKLFGPNKHKTEEELFQQIYGKCHWEE